MARADDTAPLTRAEKLERRHRIEDAARRHGLVRQVETDDAADGIIDGWEPPALSFDDDGADGYVTAPLTASPARSL